MSARRYSAYSLVYSKRMHFKHAMHATVSFCSDYSLERSDYLVERSDQRMERSGLERSGHGTKWP